jgi:hypothetical protein
MSQYQSRKRESEEVAELEWLEDGVDFLVDTAVDCTVTIISGIWQLLRGKPPAR